jgi:plasmid replication initiation protein
MKDKDWLIYADTLIRDKMNNGDMWEENRPVRLDIWNFLAATNRGDGAKQYRDALAALRRLYGVWVETNIETGEERTIEPFRYLEHFKIVTKSKTGLVTSIELKLPDWRYRAIWNARKEMLSLKQEYFELENLERRLYELARKHCGRQPYWKVGISLLWAKSGSTGQLKEFRRMVFKGQTDIGTLPEYRVMLLPETDEVIFFTKNHKELVSPLLKLSGMK